MTITTQQLERSFRYNSVDLLDPGPQYTADQVRDFYAPTYPEILNAAIEGPEEKDGKLVYTFRRAVGTKGAAPIVIVHGPMASGKTRRAYQLLAHYGCSRLVDGWDGRDQLRPGDLALTNVEPPYRISGAKVVPISTAKAEVTHAKG